MGEINLDATETTTVTIRTPNEDGSTTTHHYHVVPLTKRRLDQLNNVSKRIRQLREKAEAGTATGKDEMAAADTLATAIDARVHPANGGMTITELWEAGSVGFEHLQRLMQAVTEEGQSPPA